MSKAKTRPEVDPDFTIPSKTNASALTKAEQQFFRKALEDHKGRVWRSGWPDFLVKTRKLGFIGVEVKNGNDPIRPSQRMMFRALGRAGLLVYVWNPQFPAQLIPWRAYEIRKGGTTKIRGEHEFWRYVQTGTIRECWPWIGRELVWNQCKIGHRKLAFILAYRKKLRAYPDTVSAACGNDSCCNPLHLQGTWPTDMAPWVTPADETDVRVLAATAPIRIDAKTLPPISGTAKNLRRLGMGPIA